MINAPGVGFEPASPETLRLQRSTLASLSQPGNFIFFFFDWLTKISVFYVTLFGKFISFPNTFLKISFFFSNFFNINYMKSEIYSKM